MSCHCVYLYHTSSHDYLRSSCEQTATPPCTLFLSCCHLEVYIRASGLSNTDVSVVFRGYGVQPMGSLIITRSRHRECAIRSIYLSRLSLGPCSCILLDFLLCRPLLCGFMWSRVEVRTTEMVHGKQNMSHVTYRHFHTHTHIYIDI